MNSESVYLGVDIGTGGVRALAVDGDGRVVASGRADLPPSSSPASGLPGSPASHEQDAESWWTAMCAALRQLMARIKDAGDSPSAIRSLSVDGTSGTIVPVDAGGAALRPAMMYNDARAAAEAEQVMQDAADTCRRLGCVINASFAIAKIAWLAKHEPRTVERTARFIHQADYVAARLAGELLPTDYSNALKTGYDLIDDRWPAWLDKHSAIRDRLPPVVAPGSRIGTVCRAAAEALGLPADAAIIAGATDGTAGFLASGVHEVGQDNVTLGTTLVFKRLADRLCTHADGLIYSHKLPGGKWLPGAASNTGGQWIGAEHAGADLRELDRQAASRCTSGPTVHVRYPLARRGERFPFAAPDAEGFCEPSAEESIDRYAAGLEGVALVERLGYEVLDATTGAQCRGAIHTTGGGAASNVWMQIRADVTGRTIVRPAFGESAFGAAVLAASAMQFNDLWAAVKAMTQIDKRFEPRKDQRAAYDEKYAAFKEQLRRRGYLC